MKIKNKYVGICGLVAVLFSCKPDVHTKHESEIRYKITYKVIVEEPCVLGTERYFYTGQRGTEYNGLCICGVESCQYDPRDNTVKYVLTEREILPSKEVKNGLDDDCDGVIDNGK